MEENPVNNEGTSPEMQNNPKNGNVIKSENAVNEESPVIEEKSSWQQFKENKRLFSVFRNLIIALISLAGLLLVCMYFLYVVPALRELNAGGKTVITNDLELKKDVSYKKQISLITKDI